MEKNVIEFDPSRLPMKTKKKKGAFCRHHYVWVDAETRYLKCRDCNCNIEPFDFILGWAEDGAIINANRKWLLKEQKRLRLSVEQLKRDERNTKARIRNANKTSTTLESED